MDHAGESQRRRTDADIERASCCGILGRIALSYADMTLAATTMGFAILASDAALESCITCDAQHELLTRPDHDEVARQTFAVRSRRQATRRRARRPGER